MKKRAILILEDDPYILDMWTEQLEEYGYLTTPCETTQSAIAHLKLKKFDLFLSDFFLTDGNAGQVLKFIENSKIRIPTIIFTANTDCARSHLKHSRVVVVDKFNWPLATDIVLTFLPH